jgi:hypothetical protein
MIQKDTKTIPGHFKHIWVTPKVGETFGRKRKQARGRHDLFLGVLVYLIGRVGA